MWQKKLPEDIRDAYKLKAIHKKDPSKVMYGILQTYEEDAEKLWDEKRIVLLEEAVQGYLYQLLYDNWDFSEIPFRQFEARRDPETDFFIENEFDEFVGEAYKKAVQAHKAAGEGLHKGKLLSIGVADGLAFYQITRINKKSCSIEWRGFGCDRYVDRRWGYKTTIPHDEAKMFLCDWIERKEVEEEEDG